MYNAELDILQDKVHQTIGKAYSRMMSSKVKLASRLQIEIEEMLNLNRSVKHGRQNKIEETLMFKLHKAAAKHE